MTRLKKGDPIIVIAGLLMLAKRRVDQAAERADTEPAPVSGDGASPASTQDR